jgi:hypothetical protein
MTNQMPGSVVNLSMRATRMPDPIVVDTNIFAEYLLGAFFAPSLSGRRASRSFQKPIASNSIGMITPTAVIEDADMQRVQIDRNVYT